MTELIGGFHPKTIENYTPHVQSKCLAETGRRVEDLTEDEIHRVFAGVVQPEIMTRLALVLRREGQR